MRTVLGGPRDGAMSTTPLHVAHVSDDASPVDIAAMKAMAQYAAGELPRVQARAEKWIAGLAAIVGVLSTAAVVKGPDSIGKVAQKSGSNLWGDKHFYPKNSVVALMALGAVLLAAGIYESYRAANGSPVSLADLDRLAAEHPDAEGAAAKWIAGVKETAKSAKFSLRNAVLCTLSGGLALGGAVVVGLLNPSPPAASTPTCTADASGGLGTKYDGPLPAVTQGRVIIIPCPAKG